MDMSTTMKEQMVANYVKNIDFTNFSNSEITVSKIKQDLKNILKENPAVEIIYNGEVMVTENGDGKKNRKLIESVQSIVVAFIDGEYIDNNGNKIPKVHKFTYMVN
jgi:hypothetical protein